MRNIFFTRIFILALLVLQPMYAFSDNENNLNDKTYQNINNEIQSLSPFIGSFPPNFKSENEKTEIVKRYLESKKHIDSLLLKDPNNIQLILMRGKLQSMGHNMDMPGAWKGSEMDLLKVINKDPKNKEALVELALLYVGTNPELAPKAEELFKTAEKIPGKEFEEAIHRGLFFSYYYQGKLCEAHTQAKLLVKNWPKNEMYAALLKTAEDVISRKKIQCN